MAADSNVSSGLLKEWDTARGLLKDFDERLHDLRKYGFSFITGLLAAEGLLSPTKLLSGKPLPEAIQSILLVKLIVMVVLLVNLILIVSVRLIDRNYEVFQMAAATRALVVERVLNLELTEVIRQRFNDSHVRRYVTWIYLFFTLAVLALGLSAFWPDRGLIGATVLACAFTMALIALIGKTIKVTYPNGAWDWTLERVECTQGEHVAITLTNLGEKGALVLKPGLIAWHLKTENGEPRNEKGDVPPNGLTINPQDSYTWLLKTEQLEEGIYRVFRNVGEEKLKPLRRRLRIRPREPTATGAPAQPHAGAHISVDF